MVAKRKKVSKPTAAVVSAAGGAGIGAALAPILVTGLQAFGVPVPEGATELLTGAFALLGGMLHSSGRTK